MPLQKRLFTLSKLLVGLIKTGLQVGYSRESPDNSNNDSLLGMRLWRSSNPVLSLPTGASLLIFTMIAGCWLPRPPPRRRGEMGLGQLRHHRAHWSYWDSSILLELMLSWLPLFNFQHSENIVSDYFYQFFPCFHWGENFWRAFFFPAPFSQMSLTVFPLIIKNHLWVGFTLSHLSSQVILDRKIHNKLHQLSSNISFG